MDFKGSLKNVQREWGANIPLVQLRLTDGHFEGLKDLFDKVLDISIKVHHDKRSLNANNYLWALVEKMAVALKTSKDEVYRTLLDRYGYLYKDDDGRITLTVKADFDIGAIIKYPKLYTQDPTGKWKVYFAIRGTSEYDTAEMAYFLDMVIEEAKELEIETATPAEVAKMVELWGAEREKRCSKA